VSRGWKVRVQGRGLGLKCEGLRCSGACLGFRVEGSWCADEGQGCMV